MRMAYGYYPGLGADTRCTESGGFDELRQLCYKLMESIASNRQLWGAQVYVLCTLLLYWFLRQYAVQLFLFYFCLTFRQNVEQFFLSYQPTDKMSIYLMNLKKKNHLVKSLVKICGKVRLRLTYIIELTINQIKTGFWCKLAYIGSSL